MNGKPLRSILYDTVSDKYGQFLLEELLPEVYAKYNIRKDAYSRAIQGQSSGGIAAFTVAFNHPESFSRVYTVVGSFTALQWKPGEIDGGNIYPFKVRREPKRNLRVWMNDGSEDQEANSGSWPLQNIQLANSLKLKGYDFHFSFGGGSHHAALAASELPECLTWLWRDYDPAKTEQIFEQSAEEKVEAARSASESTTGRVAAVSCSVDLRSSTRRRDEHRHDVNACHAFSSASQAPLALRAIERTLARSWLKIRLGSATLRSRVEKSP